MPLTAGMQLLLTSLIGAFCFGEWPYTWQMGLGFAGIALIIAGTVLTTHTRQASRALLPQISARASSSRPSPLPCM